MTKNAKDRNGERGISFIELVVSLALLAVVLVSLFGLLVFGGRQVNSGRCETEALAVARTILEEMQGWGFRQTYETYGYDGTAATYSVDTRTNSYAAKWQPVLDQKLHDSYAIIKLDSLGYPVTTMEITHAIRAVVTVHWQEGPRHRSIQLGSVRM